MAAHLTGRDCEGIQRVLCIRVVGWADDMLWNDNRKVRNGISKWEEYEGTDFEDLQTIKVVRMPLIGKSRWTLTCFINTKLTEIFLLWQMSSYRLCR
jgi:hypothetical protein